MENTREIKWVPCYNISNTAYFNGIRNLPHWSVLTNNKKGVERLVTVVRYDKNNLELIIDGVHHKCNVFNMRQMVELFFGSFQAAMFSHVLLNNPIFE